MGVFRITASTTTESELAGNKKPPGFGGTGQRPGGALALDWFVVFEDENGDALAGGSATVQWYGVEVSGSSYLTPTIGDAVEVDALDVHQLAVAETIWPWCRVTAMDAPEGAARLRVYTAASDRAAATVAAAEDATAALAAAAEAQATADDAAAAATQAGVDAGIALAGAALRYVSGTITQTDLTAGQFCEVNIADQFVGMPVAAWIETTAETTSNNGDTTGLIMTVGTLDDAGTDALLTDTSVFGAPGVKEPVSLGSAGLFTRGIIVTEPNWTVFFSATGDAPDCAHINNLAVKFGIIYYSTS